MALYLATTGIADPVKFSSSMTAFDQAVLRIIPACILSGLTVDGTGNVQVGEALIGHVVAIATVTSITAALAASTTNYVYIQLPAAPTCVGTDGRDIGVLIVNQTGVAPVNALLLATVVTGVAAAITSVNTAPVGRVQTSLPIPRFADGETPAGTINGANTIFTLAHSPSPAASLRLYINWVLQNPANYTVSGATVTFTTAPATGVSLMADYRY